MRYGSYRPHASRAIAAATDSTCLQFPSLDMILDLVRRCRRTARRLVAATKLKDGRSPVSFTITCLLVAAKVVYDWSNGAQPSIFPRSPIKGDVKLSTYTSSDILIPLILSRLISRDRQSEPLCTQSLQPRISYDEQLPSSYRTSLLIYLFVCLVFILDRVIS